MKKIREDAGNVSKKAHIPANRNHKISAFMRLRPVAHAIPTIFSARTAERKGNRRRIVPIECIFYVRTCVAVSFILAANESYLVASKVPNIARISSDQTHEYVLAGKMVFSVQYKADAKFLRARLLLTNSRNGAAFVCFYFLMSASLHKNLCTSC